jgi:hypothetical protein
VNIVSDKKVRTRKQHKCWGCKIAIPIGDIATRINNVDGDSLSSSYWCDVCVTFMNSLPSYETEDGFLYGELTEYPDHPFHKTNKRIPSLKALKACEKAIVCPHETLAGCESCCNTLAQIDAVLGGSHE